MLPLVITVRSVDGSSRRYAFAESPVSIGRSPFAELQLTEPFVSRWEGTLRFDEHEVTYFILGSTNPTYIDGRLIEARDQDVAVPEHAELAIGELSLRFTREPVADADLRHKGKRKPAHDERELAAKTMYLDAVARGPAASGPSAAPAAALAERRLGSARARVASPSSPERAASLSATERAADDARGASTPPAALEGSDDVPASDDIAALYRAYRSAFGELLAGLERALVSAPTEQRAELAEQLQRRCPRSVSEPDFRALLRRLELPVMRSDVPEVREWLLAIGKDILPPQLQLDSGLTLERILRLLELLAQSLAEVHAAQDSVRSRWLGRAPRRSVLHSENGLVLLAYMLNPKADFRDRVAELEQTVRDAVTHELALFKAMLEAARKLVDSLSPEALSTAEQGAGAQTEPNRAGLWRRLRGEAPEVRLWQRLVAAHGALLDGNRYQRFFLGRMFAHSYLAAMGQNPESKAPPTD
jgi:predicted component of type VI protein secretion system